LAQVVNEQKHLPVETFRAMERMDEQQILRELQGELISEFVYSIQVQGRTVTNLSYSGIKEVIRRRGDIEILDVKTAADETPGITRELIRTTKARLRDHRKELNAAAKLSVELRSLVETGKLPLEIAQLLESKVPKKFLEDEAKHVIENRLNLEETESYLTVQEAIYRVHEHNDNPERSKTSTPKIEFVKLNEYKIRGRTGANINLKDLELTTASGKRVELFEEIQHALRKLSPGDEAEITVIVWAKPKPIEAR